MATALLSAQLKVMQPRLQLPWGGGVTETPHNLKLHHLDMMTGWESVGCPYVVFSGSVQVLTMRNHMYPRHRVRSDSHRECIDSTVSMGQASAGGVVRSANKLLFKPIDICALARKLGAADGKPVVEGMAIRALLRAAIGTLPDGYEVASFSLRTAGPKKVLYLKLLDWSSWIQKSWR